MTRHPYSMYFTRVAWLGSDHYAVSGHLPASADTRVTRIAEVKQGKWSQLGDLPELVATLCAVRKGPIPRLHAMLRNGVIHTWTGGRHQVEIIDRERGLFFSELRQIGTDMYACGAGLQVFRRSDKGWGAIDQGIFVDPSPDRSAALKAVGRVLVGIDGRDASDVYAVGTGGHIFHTDGQRWRALESPTNLGLMRVRYCGKRLLACGYHGLVLEGGLQGWRTLNHQRGAPPLLDIGWFGDRVFMASEFTLFELIGEALIPVDLRGIENPTFGALDGDGTSILLSVGGETLLAFDGESWTPLSCPWNDPV